METILIKLVELLQELRDKGGKKKAAEVRVRYRRILVRESHY